MNDSKVYQGARVVVFALLQYLIASAGQAATAKNFNVRDFGATGDGTTIATAAINKAIEACAAAGGGTVRFPAGTYLSGTVILKSHVHLALDAGATLKGSTNLADYGTLRASSASSTRFRPSWHNALILGDEVEQITISGPGTIDGSQVFNPEGEENMRGPHTVVLGKCRNITLENYTLIDSANYAHYFTGCEQFTMRGLRILGGWDGIHFRGGNNVQIENCQIHTGDDAIAGAYWTNVVIQGCVLNSSCNGVRLIGPATHLRIQDCLIYGPGLYEHRTALRHNTIAALNLQPGAWFPTSGKSDDIRISDVTIANLRTPIYLRLMGPENTMGSIEFSRITATGAGRIPSIIEGTPEHPLTHVVFNNVNISVVGGGKLSEAQALFPPAEKDPWTLLPTWGFSCRYIQSLKFNNVRLASAEPDQRAVLTCSQIDSLMLTDFAFPQGMSDSSPLAFDQVGKVITERCAFSQVHGSLKLPSGEVKSTSVTNLWPPAGRLASSTSSQTNEADFDAVVAPFAVFASTEAACKQTGDRFYICAGGSNLLFRTEEYGTVFLKHGLKDKVTALVKINLPVPQTGLRRARVGLMVRNNLTQPGASSGYLVLAESVSNGWAMEWDADGDGRLDAHTQFAGYSQWPSWLKLERQGSRFTGWYSTDGSAWKKVGVVDLPGSAPVQDIGMFASRTSATFESFKITGIIP